MAIVQAWFVKKTYGFLEFEIPDEELEGKVVNVQKRIINKNAREQDPGNAKWIDGSEIEYDGYYVK